MDLAKENTKRATRMSTKKEQIRGAAGKKEEAPAVEKKEKAKKAKEEKTETKA